jgi:hypothetical protein
MLEIGAGETLQGGRVRRAGGGRRALTERDPTLLLDLEALVTDQARGDLESPLLWTAKSVRTLAGALREQGHGSVMRRSPSFCARWGTACRPTAR